MASIVLENVNKSFRDSEIIKNVNLTIEDGKCTVLVGPSGCGKSTLLRLICGLEEVTSGDIFIGDRLVNDIPPASRGLAMVFQTYALYPHMTVFENMAFALKVRKYKKAEIEDLVVKAARTLKIDHLLDRKPKELSGGQRQRVAIGRAIVRNPFAFLFDEPLSNLDTALRCQMRYELAKLKEQLKTTMVYVTHDQAEAMTLADKIVVMKDGIIEQVGSPLELYKSPVNVFVAKFIGSSEMNILEMNCVQQGDKSSVFHLSTNEEIVFKRKADFTLDPSSRYLFGIRPEDLEILPADSIFFGNKLKGTVTLSENLGGEGFVHVSLADGTSITVKAKNINVHPGDSVKLGCSYDKCYLFDKDMKTIWGQTTTTATVA
ncbi:MAG: ABC transporter ATP-binding protein [Alphaproteobacteria bacterium]|nr:ABC transporter ATP-binding protein [Alphaproteobacteria bacterium]